MVNYCCVAGCGRNSRSSQNLYYYSVPKETSRQERWLKAAGRQDLLEKPNRMLYRFCSRHFAPSSFKNKHLCADAVPTLCLPGSEIDVNTEDSSDERLVHQNIACDNCGNTVSGFRYKCMTCSDYDLCSRCEINEAHSQHYMLRIPTPSKSKSIEDVMKKWQELYEKSYSSDDEPITKYIKNKDNATSKNYDSGVELSEDVKEMIRKEVDKVCTEKPAKKRRMAHRPAKTENVSKRAHVEVTNMVSLFGNAPEVVFADCNAAVTVGTNDVNVKIEPVPNLTPLEFTSENNIQFMQMKLNDDLSELMMEVQNSAQTMSSVHIE